MIDIKKDFEVLQIEYSEGYFDKQKRNCLWNMKLHSHNLNELYYLCTGRVQYNIDGEVFDLEAGNVIFIPKGMTHKTTSISITHERVVLNFSDVFFDENIGELLSELFSNRVLVIPEKKRAYFEKILIQILKEKEKPDQFSEKLIGQYFYQMVVFLNRVLQVDDKEKHIPQYICEAIEYIKSNYKEELTLNGIAEKVNANSSYLSRKFKELVGVGISEYINDYRIVSAAELLISTDYSVLDIAMMCDFNNSNYFAAIFKQKYDVTPLKYRAMHNEKIQ